MIKRILIGFASVAWIATLLIAAPLTASAAFSPNNIMVDSVFNNSGTMGVAQIDAFLNSFPNSCISTNRGFVSPDVIGYNPSQGYLYGGNVSAGNVITHAAQAYDLNPQVILATLQKEQSLVSGSAGCHYETPATLNPCPDPPYGTNSTCVPACQYSGGCVYIAMGYDCPYYCVPNSTGFSKQIIKAAWKMKFVQQRSLGNYNWNIQKPGWDNSDDPLTSYDGYMTQGLLKRNASSSYVNYDGYRPVNNNSLSVHLDSGATASLYSYTPFTSGNSNFVSIFEGWFGSTQTNIPFAWSYQGQWAYVDSGRTQQFTSTPTVTPGATIYARVKARNIGNQTWANSVVRLGTSRPIDRASQFFDNGSWLSYSRAIQLLEASVVPGEIGTFDFTFKAPSSPGTYNEYFNLLAEGHTWMNDPGMFFTINVNSSAAANNSNRSTLNSGESISKDDVLLSPDSQSVLTLQRDGNLVLNSNFKPAWSTGALGSAANQLLMQPDGNLVLYPQSGPALWNSQTGGNPGARLVLQTDGNMVIYNASNAVIWATYTLHTPDHLSYVNTTLNEGRLYPGQSLDTADRRLRLILQPDGNLVLYSPTRALWASSTVGKQAAFLAMQPDGNLVLYDRDSRPIWNSGTSSTEGLHLHIQQDGNLVLYNAFGRPFWNTGTNGSL